MNTIPEYKTEHSPLADIIKPLRNRIRLTTAEQLVLVAEIAVMRRRIVQWSAFAAIAGVSAGFVLGLAL